MPGFRYQLAAYSPISLSAITAAAMGWSGDRHRGLLREYLRRAYAADTVVLVDSGTHALQLAIANAVARRGASTLIALPAFGCYDLATALVGTSARVILYDLDPATLAPDEKSLDACFRAGASAAVITPLYGIPVPWGNLDAIAKVHGGMLIEDAAQGHGGRFRDQPLGAAGEVSTLSFSRGKGWTGGHGGAVLGRSGAAVSLEEVQSSGGRGKNLVLLSAQWALGRPSVYGIPRRFPFFGLGETRYHEPSPIHFLDEPAAAAIMRTRDAADLEAGKRRAIAKELMERLASTRAKFTTIPAGSSAGYIRLPARIPAGMGGFRHAGDAERLGIARSYPSLLADLPALAPRVAKPIPAPGAAELVRCLVTLPTHSLLSESDLDTIEKEVASL